MGMFSPYKKHANPFRYVPRFFDPDKEEREQRRRELLGQSAETDSLPYTPGQYIKTMHEARNEKRNKQTTSSKVVILGGIAIAVLLIYALYPRIVNAFSQAKRQNIEQRMLQEYEEFNPNTPITIVPNDYKEE